MAVSLRTPFGPTSVPDNSPAALRLRDTLSSISGANSPGYPNTAPPGSGQASDATNRGSAPGAGNSQGPPIPAQAGFSIPGGQQSLQGAAEVGPATVPLPLQGKTFAQQAQILSSYLSSFGLEVPEFKVGGQTDVDPQINLLIDQINDPSSSPTLRRMAAVQILGLIPQRNRLATNATLVYNPATGEATPITGRNAGDLIGGLLPPPIPDGGSGSGRLDIPGVTDSYTPTADRFFDPAMIRDVLDELITRAAGGGVSDEERTLMESQLVNELEANRAIESQYTADRFGSNGVFGGRVQDALADIDRNSQVARARGLSDIRLGIADQQRQSRASALEATLRLAGIAGDEAEAMARLITDRQISQADLATRRELSGDQLANELEIALARIGVDGTQLANQMSEAQMRFIIDLLDLDQNADVETKAAIRDLLATLGIE